MGCRKAQAYLNKLEKSDSKHSDLIDQFKYNQPALLRMEEYAFDAKETFSPENLEENDQESEIIKGTYKLWRVDFMIDLSRYQLMKCSFPDCTSS